MNLALAEIVRHECSKIPALGLNRAEGKSPGVPDLISLRGVCLGSEGTNLLTFSGQTGSALISWFSACSVAPRWSPYPHLACVCDSSQASPLPLRTSPSLSSPPLSFQAFLLLFHKIQFWRFIQISLSLSKQKTKQNRQNAGEVLQAAL